MVRPFLALPRVNGSDRAGPEMISKERDDLGGVFTPARFAELGLGNAAVTVSTKKARELLVEGMITERFEHGTIIGAALKHIRERVDTSDLLVVNPVRKGPSYLAAHPELFDIDGSGTIDPWDVASIEAAFGRTAADSDYLRLLDPNGDGVIDGEDRSHARTALRKERGIPRR